MQTNNEQNYLFNHPDMMPDEYKGEFMKSGGITKFSPRKWTDKEIEWVKKLKDKGLSTKYIAECIDRDVLQVSIKLKRLSKNDKTYNEPHRKEKYETNEMFLSYQKIKSVLDVFAGKQSFYHGKGLLKVVSNDIDQDANTDFHLDSLIFCCMQYAQGNKYDLVDLDPFGSAYDCFDFAIKMAKKGLIITLGEMGHKRFKRLDFVRRYYGIESLEGFTSQNLINHIIKIGERNKKRLIPVFIKDWHNISRVYFLIEKMKITEQWNKNDVVSEMVCECCWKRFDGQLFDLEEVFMCEECYLYNTEE